jgi:hypothetical protein
MITVNQKDALRAKTLPPGWQVCKVTNQYNKPSAGDGSTNFFYEIVVVKGEFKKVPLSEYLVNEKATGMGKNFFIACGQPKEQWDKAEKGEAFSFDEKLPMGKFVKVHVKPEPFGNRTLNKATDFMPVTEADMQGVDTEENY